MLDNYHVGDTVTVQFIDEDKPITGKVDRDNTGRLYLDFGDGTVAYTGFKVTA